ncbi:MAG: allophanate hydrolase [Alphaproteobacteria bacterium]|nr:MAG: allophanate hydrolase [Alphaproteobacteria bacterium]
MPLPDLQRAALAHAYGTGLTPTAVVEAILAAIPAEDPTFLLVTAERARAAAAALDPADRERLPLWGVPFAVKDNIDVAGLVTTAACPGFARVAATSATVVERLEAAGALLIGKTNLDQFATGLVGTRSPYGVPVNPLAPDRVPGGSSSGSAVAVARGLVTFALGTDTAGSGRVPAGFTNIVGLKPTRGVIPTTGVVPACRSLDCVSVFAGSVADATAVLAVAAGPDGADAMARVDGKAVAVPVGVAPPALRVAVPAEADLAAAPAWRAGFEAAREALAADGAHFVDVGLQPFFDAAAMLYSGPWVAERTAAVGEVIAAGVPGLDPVVSTIIRGGERMSAVDAFAGQYRLAEVAAAARALWRQVDVLLVPTVPGHPTLADLAAEPIAANSALGRYTNFVNLLDMAALAVPAGFRDDLPVGVTLIGPALADPLLAAVGERLHRRLSPQIGATQAQLVSPASIGPTTSPDRIPVVVVGAHLSGLPLNPQLTSAGGRLLAVTHTAAIYRLYALAGFTPPRPGMVRVSEDGVALAVEVWDLPAEAFGRFVAGIPAPLGIGTVTLADGSTAPGFLCEPVALAGARDLSSFGGWRAAMAAGAVG